MYERSVDGSLSRTPHFLHPTGLARLLRLGRARDGAQRRHWGFAHGVRSTARGRGSTLLPRPDRRPAHPVGLRHLLARPKRPAYPAGEDRRRLVVLRPIGESRSNLGHLEEREGSTSYHFLFSRVREMTA